MLVMLPPVLPPQRPDDDDYEELQQEGNVVY
jgi:hypothetical protein